MAQISTARAIAAPPDRVFEVVAHIQEFRKINADIIDIEFLTESHRGVGTRFRETRLMRGRKATTTLEVTEYNPPKSVRLVSDAGGTIWDTLFTITPAGSGSTLRLLMDARPHNLVAKLTTPFFMRMIGKAVGADLDAVKAHCESTSDS